MRGQLLFPAVVVVALLAGPGIPCCWGWVPAFVQVLCLCGVVIEIVMGHYRSLPLDYCQWMAQPQLIQVSVRVMMVVHVVVFAAILRN